MTKSLTALTSGLAKRNPRLRRALRTTMRQAQAARVRLTARGNIEPRTATFTSFLGLSYNGSPRAIYEHLLSDPRFADWRFTWAFATPAVAIEEFTALLDERTTVVTYRSGKFHRAVTRGAWYVTNSLPADYLQTRQGQALLQTWHGTPFKRLGADIIDATSNATNSKNEIVSRYRRAGHQATYFLSSSQFTSDKFASAFLLSAEDAASKILPLGNPRNDVLAQSSGSARDETRARLGVSADRTAILYTPTWRDDSHSAGQGFVHALDVDLDLLHRELGKDHVLLFRTHYLIANTLDFSRWGDFVVDVSGYPEINDLYAASDLLVTDYSSAVFDYVITDKPMVFLMQDLEQYRDTVRGLYFDPDKLPGPIVRDTAGLAAAARSTRERASAEQTKRAVFRANFSTWDDGGASERVASLMLRGSMIQGDGK